MIYSVDDNRYVVGTVKMKIDIVIDNYSNNIFLQDGWCSFAKNCQSLEIPFLDKDNNTASKELIFRYTIVFDSFSGNVAPATSILTSRLVL